MIRLEKNIFLLVLAVPMIVGIILTYVMYNLSQNQLHKIINENKEFITKNFKEKLIEEKNKSVNSFLKELVLNYNLLLENRKELIKELVDNTYLRQKKLYEKLHKLGFDNKKIISIIKNNLRNIKYFNGYGYYFIYDTNYNCILLPIKPSLEGKNLKNYVDVNNRKIVVELVNNAIKNGSYWDSWYYGNNKEKIGYVRYIKNLKIVIGMSLYKYELENKFIEFLKHRNNLIRDNIIFLHNRLIVGDKKKLINPNYILFKSENKKLGLKLYLVYSKNSLNKDINCLLNKYKESFNNYQKLIINKLLIIFLIGTTLSIILAFILSKMLNKYINEINNLNLKLDEKVNTINQELEESNEKYQKIFDYSSHLIALLDENFRFLDVNKKSISLLGFKKEDLIGKEIGFSLNGKEKEFFNLLKKELKKKGEINIRDLTIHTNGKILYVSGFATKIIIHDKIHYLVIVEDISDYKELLQKYQILNKSLEEKVKEKTEELQKQQELMLVQSRFATMGEMIGMIAHQWRQPLNVISLIGANIELAVTMDGGISNEELLKEVEKLKETVRHMTQTIEDFRNMLLPAKNQEKVKIKSLFKDVLRLIKAQLDTHSIKVENNCQLETEIFINPSEFKQVLLNILSNSKDEFITKEIKNPKIEIECQEKEIQDLKCIEISIIDNAGGIKDKEILNHIFEPYFSTKGKNGTGIGLYMSKLIVNRGHGDILAKNVENGLEIKIILPIATQENIERILKLTGGGRT